MINIIHKIDGDPVKPPVIFLDEWSANLSKENEAAMLQIISRWSKDIAIVQITHH